MQLWVLLFLLSSCGDSFVPSPGWWRETYHLRTGQCSELVEITRCRAPNLGCADDCWCEDDLLEPIQNRERRYIFACWHDTNLTVANWWWEKLDCQIRLSSSIDASGDCVYSFVDRDASSLECGYTVTLEKIKEIP